MNKILNFNKISAFTLAEVLITLGIIGVVAALTIPALFSNSDDRAFDAGFKKAYSLLSQMTSAAKNDNGGTLIGAFSDAQTSLDLYKTKLKYTKECSTTSPSDTGGLSFCWPKDTYGWGDPTPDTDGQAYSNYTPGLILNDGMLLLLLEQDSQCNICNGPAFSCPTDEFKACNTIVMDVNGLKKPNMYGKDIYSFHIYKSGKVLPDGVIGDYNETNCGPTAFKLSYNVKGFGCGGWKLRGKSY